MDEQNATEELLVVNEPKKRRDNLLLLIILVPILTAGFFICLHYFLIRPEIEGYIRQEEEEDYVNVFFEDIKNDTVETISVEDVDVTYVDSELEYEDNYDYLFSNGMKYTPEYAKGHLDCVLEVPSIQMRRGVYSGTYQEIKADLNMWMTTAAHPNYELGKTHYCVYGHNSQAQHLSWNDLKNVQVGDYFMLTNSRFVYLYDVTKFFAQWREHVTQDIINNWDLPKTQAYLITCGRNEYRYRDIIVVGELRKRYTLKEWEEVKGDITATRVETKYTREEEDTRPRLELSAENTDTAIMVTLHDPDGNPIKDTGICVTDEDGLFVENLHKEFVRTDENGRVEFPIEWFEDEKTYVIGTELLELEDFRNANDVAFTVDTEHTTKVVSYEKVVTKQEMPDWYLYLWGGMILLSGILILTCIVAIIVKIVKRIQYRAKKS